ncbi:MAG: hypothetical protein ACK4TA_04305 [Saprospiraceae bacterium]
MNKTLFSCGLILVLGMLLTNAASAQTTSIFDTWPELKTFHGVMSTTFHPAEQGDLKPIRTRSGEMVEKATALAKSKVPAEVNKPEVLAALKKLRSGSKSLHKLVKKQGSDVEITKSLTALHDVFHEIVGLCTDEDH